MIFHKKLILNGIVLLISLFILTACPEENLKSDPPTAPMSEEPTPSKPPVPSSEKRLALVIGNSNYDDGLELSNPVNDARGLARVLRQLNFEVIEKINLNRKQMKIAIRKFSRKLSKNKGVGLFYFSGHGIQAQGKNYLLPVGVKDSLKVRADLPDETVRVSYILELMNEAKNDTNIIILDACRNLPRFLKSWAKGEMISPGLTHQRKPPGSLIAYAAAPGEVALSGEGEPNSPYAKYLIKWMKVPNLSITEMLTKVRVDVIHETLQYQWHQYPEYSSALNGPFYFQKTIEPSNIDIEQPSFQVSQLLPVCEKHFQAGRLSGGDGTALACYRKVLMRAPTNSVALAGLEKVEKRYVTLTQAALKIKNGYSARQYLTNLRKVNPGLPLLAGLEEQLASLGGEQVLVAGKVFRDHFLTLKTESSLGPEMVWIPAGSFRMGDLQGGGDYDEKPIHEVVVNGFAMSRSEVTVEEFRRFVNATGYQTEAEKGEGCYSYKKGLKKMMNANWRKPEFSQAENHPVVCVSWHDAMQFAQWLSQETGRQYRLPTEAEWEYAARAGTKTLRYWGNDPNEACRYANVADQSAQNEINDISVQTFHNCTDGYIYTAPVGQFQPNVFGLFDMLGNVWEWTCSQYEDKYSGKEKSCLSRSEAENKRLSQRGGDWGNEPTEVRAAHRYGWTPSIGYFNVGLRLVRQ